MPRTFNGSSTYITLSPGAFNGIPFTYGTQAVLVKRGSTGGSLYQEMLVLTGASNDWYLAFTPSDQIEFFGNTSAATFTSTTTWLLIMCTKPNGASQTVRLHIYDYTAGSWSHNNMTGTLNNGSVNLTQIDLGRYYNGTEFFNGDIAAAGLFRQWVPTDAEVESLGMHANRLGWFAAAARADKAAIWLLDQSATTMPVLDETGGGANESGGTLPAISTNALPLFSYGGSILTSSTVTAAGTGVITLVNVGAQAAGNTAATNLTAVLPTGVVAGDLLLLIVAGRPFDSSADGVSASGYTQRGTTAFRAVASVVDLSVQIWWKIAGASEGNASVAANTILANGSTDRGWSVQLAAFRGVDQTTPFDVTSVNTTAAAATTLAPTGITTVTDRAWALSIVATSDDNALALLGGSEQGFTAIMSGANYDTTAGSDHAVGLAYKDISPVGAVTQPTWNQTLVGSDDWAAIATALRPAAGSTGTAYTDDVTTTIVADTTGTVDVLAAIESLVTTGVGVTTGTTDVAAFNDSVTTTGVVVTNIVDSLAALESVTTIGVVDTSNTVDSRGMFESLSTTIVGVTSATDAAGFFETPTTIGVVVTSETDVVTYTESVVTTGVVLTGIIDSLAMLEDATTVVVGVTSEVDIFGMVDTVQTIIVGTTSATDSAGYTELPVTTVVGLTSVVDTAVYNDNVVTTIVALTGESDVLAMYETPTIVGIVSTSSTDQLAMSESVVTTGVVTTSDVDVAAFFDTPTTVIVALTDEYDELNGTPAPAPSRVYFGSIILNI